MIKTCLVGDFKTLYIQWEECPSHVTYEKIAFSIQIYVAGRNASIAKQQVYLLFDIADS